MALASLGDVKRVMQVDDVDEARDAKIRASLAAVESWAESRMRHIGKDGPQVEVYWDIYEDATLHLPVDDAVVTKVKVYEYPSSAGVPLSPIDLGLGHGYDLTDDGKLYLRPTLMITPFEGAVGQRALRAYARVEVHYIGSGVIPRAVTEGIALLAAGYFTDTPRTLAAMKSEKIGDYSYALKDRSETSGLPEYVDQAMWFLVPFLRKMRIAVV